MPKISEYGALIADAMFKSMCEELERCTKEGLEELGFTEDALDATTRDVVLPLLRAQTHYQMIAMHHKAAEGWNSIAKEHADPNDPNLIRPDQA
jgi:hypothetical protein